jgi:hypothetical protein
MWIRNCYYLMRSPSISRGVRVVWYFVLCLIFCKLLFMILFFCFWPLHCRDKSYFVFVFGFCNCFCFLLCFVCVFFRTIVLYLCTTFWLRFCFVYFVLLVLSILYNVNSTTICYIYNGKRQWCLEHFLWSLWRVCRYHRGNQNPYIEEEQTTQWPR